MTGPDAFLIVGDDPYLVSEELHKILENTSPLAVDEFDSEGSAAAVVQALATPSMFGENRTVLVRGVDAMPAESQKTILDYLEDPVGEGTLVMTAARPVSRLAAVVRRLGRVIEAAKGKRSDLFNWLGEQSKAKGLRLSGEAMAALMDSVGESRGALAGAVDELALAHAAGARLGKKEIERQFQHRPEARLFAFVDAVAERRRGEALDTLGRLIAQGEAPQLLIWNLNRHLRMMLAVRGDSPAQAAKTLGIQPWRAEKLVRQARGLPEEALVSAYIRLAEADHKMKRSEEPDSLTLERTVTAICEG